MERGCGILLHVSSLPDQWGIGCFSRSCFQFIDFLKSAGVKYWQVLGMGPTGYGDSPYACFSVFAGNPYFIDLSKFFSDAELKKYNLQSKGNRVDYGNLFVNRNRALRDLYARGYDKVKLAKFISDNKYWIKQYATYMAIKEAHGNVGYLDLPPAFRDPKSAEVKKFTAENPYAIYYHIFVQMLFAEQWAAVKKYANERGIRVIGDVPIYPAMDSADVWAYNNQFDFVGGKPAGVAGVPPDYFNENGQLWGNPLYNFKQMSRDKYKWFTERLAHTGRMFDILRIDHFRGLDSYYKIPFGAKTAKEGTWCKGPGIKFFNAIKAALPNLKIVLEDLGEITKSVVALRDATGFPGMRVMQFGFDGNSDNEHLPANYTSNCTAYIGTHDNDTFVGFLKSAPKQTRAHIEKYLHCHGLGLQDTTRLAFENILASPAKTVVLCIQDLLFQDNKSRMNNPGTSLGNWQYRITDADLSAELAAYIKMLIERSGRL